MTPTDRPSKQEAFLAFLKDGWVTVYIDARRPGVAVPDHLRNETRLVLQYGLNMPVPVEDLDVSEAGVKATLSFSRQPWQTLIPWTAIYVIACTDGRGVLYQEDVPTELMTAFEGTDGTEDGDDAPDAKMQRKPAAAVAMVPDVSEPDEPAAPADGTVAPRSRLKSVPMPEPPKTDTADATFGDDDDDDNSPAPKGRPRLTLVKP